MLKNILGGFNKESRVSIAPNSSVPRPSASSPQYLPPPRNEYPYQKEITQTRGVYSSSYGTEEKEKPFKLPVRQSPRLFPRFPPSKSPTGTLVPSLQQQLMPNLIQSFVTPRQRCDFSLPLGLILLAISTLSFREADAFHQTQPGWTWRSSSAPVKMQKLSWVVLI